MKKIITGLLTVIMLSTPCVSVFAWGRRHHRPWRHRHYRRRHSFDAGMFAIPLAIAATAAMQKPTNVSGNSLWREIINNRIEIKNLAQRIANMATVVADRDTELDRTKKIIDEMRDRIRELEVKIK